MNIGSKITASKGIIDFVFKYKIGKLRNKSFRAQEELVNNIVIKFGKEHGIEMKKNNSPRYKGSFNPLMENSEAIQDNWSKFRQWVKENYERDK